MIDKREIIENGEIQIIDISEIKILGNEQSRKLIELKQPYRFNGIFVALIKGDVSFRADGNKKHDSNGVFLLLWKYSYVEILRLAKDAEIRIIMITTDTILEKQFFDNIDYISAMYKQPYMDVSNEEMTQLIDFGRFMLEQQNINNKKYQAELNRQLSFALFLKLRSIYIEKNIVVNANSESAEYSVQEKFHILLFKYIWTETSVSFYAEKLNLSTQELSSIIEKEWGDTAENWIAQLRINQIIINLRTLSVSAEDIVERFHFLSIADLESYFMLHTGKHISEYTKIPPSIL